MNKPPARNPPAAESAPQYRRTSFAEKLAWGAGGMTEGSTNCIYALAFPIYSIALGVPAAMIGAATAISRLVDSITDPVLGNISDNTRSRWGRRRPFIFIGAILIGILMPLIYMPNPVWSQAGLFAWFTALTVLFFIAFTIWSIPWSALGLELSDDYDDRTRLQVFRMVFATFANLAANWVYKICFLFDADEVVGVRPVAMIIGGTMLLLGVLSALFIREWREIKAQPAINLLKALKATLSNKPFLLLCGSVLFFAGGLILVGPMLLYVNIYHVYDGDRDAASTIMGVSGTVGVVFSLAFLPLGGWLAERLGKRRAALVALSMIILGKGSQFWLVTPEAPYIQLLTRAIFDPGIIMMWALIPSMIADVCDVDELKTGNRREASFSSVYQWIWKFGATFSMIAGGSLISLVGADVAEADQMLSADVVFRLRLLLAIVPTMFGVIAFICIWSFPLTRDRIEVTKAELAAKRATGHASGLGER